MDLNQIAFITVMTIGIAVFIGYYIKAIYEAH